MSAQAYQQYRETEVGQADPVRLVALLYDGALKFIRAAAQTLASVAEQGATELASPSEHSPDHASAQLQLRAAQLEQAHLSILRVYAIVSELTATLDYEAGGEVARKLEQLYDFVLHKLREADMQKQPQPLREAERILEGLRQTWAEAFPQGLASLPQEQRGQVGPGRRPQQPAPAAPELEGAEAAIAAAPRSEAGDPAGTMPPAPQSGLNLVG